MSLSCVAVNQGNTSTKWGVFKENKLVETFRTFHHEEETRLAAKLNSYGLPYFGISVCNEQRQHELFSKLEQFQRITTPDFPNHSYETGMPGEDRLTNVAGAGYLFPTYAALIVDFGTCITYTLALNGQLAGGAISPGVLSRLKSMHDYTGNLPAVSFEKPLNLLATTTVDSMRSGVYNGIIGELNAFIEQTRATYRDVSLVFTGSDATHFAEPLEYRIFVEENLTLFGIYALAQRLSFSH